MNATALAAIVAVGLRMNLRRLTIWIFAAVFLLIVFLLYAGLLRFGGMAASGVKLAVNADYAIAMILGVFSFGLMHFTATLCGDPVVKDVRLGTTHILRALPVGSRTYVVGKFLAGYASVLTIYAVFLAALFFGQALPHGADVESLPFRILPFFKFALLFVLVPTFFVGAASFCIGTLTGSMKTVYLAVTVLLVAWALVTERLEDMELRWLAYFEPSGITWLSEQVARSRGNAWLNTHSIQPDLGFLLNRVMLLAAGAGALAYTVYRYPSLEHRSEYAGEVRPGLLGRALRWARGRQPELEDRYSNWSGAGAVPRVEPSRRDVAYWLRHAVASTEVELRLLLGERSLWIMVPMIMLMAGVDASGFSGPFRVPIYPVSSEFAQRMVPTLLIMLVGTTIFYTGEVFHRDDAGGVRGILYATPISNSAMLLGKLAAMFALSAFMVLATIATAVVSQAVQWYDIDGRTYFEPGPYVEIGLHVLLPAIVFLCTTALVVNVLVRGRYLAYFLLLGLGGGYIWLLIEGERSLLQNPLQIGHWRYSDITGLEPFAESLRLHHVYWGSLLVALCVAATWFLERTRGGWRQYLSGSRALRHLPLLATGVVALAVAGWSGADIAERGNVRGTEGELERAALELEERYLDRIDEPRLAYRSVDMDVRLRPSDGALDVRATVELVNPYPQPVAEALFTIDPLYEIRAFEIDGQSAPYTLDHAVLAVALEEPLRSGGSTTLRLDWSGVVGPGFPANGGPEGTFLHESAIFLTSFAPQVLPVPGLSPELFLADRERRGELGLPELQLLRDRSDDAYVPSLFGSDVPFEMECRIEAPEELDVLSAGDLVAREEAAPGPTGEPYRRSTFRTDGPVFAFAILAAEYSIAKNGDDEVHYHPTHTYNLATILDALGDSRRRFEEAFGPYPHRLLRIGEFPRLAAFAQSYPTLMPYSEAIGFLTHCGEDPRTVDATYFVTSHEVAHQWWGYVVNAGASLGAQVLVESLAEYSAMVLIDEERGERARLRFLKHEEDRYLRARDADTEVALADLALEGQPVWYNKGCLVFYMLERRIGRDRLLAALSEFAAEWRDSDSHPVLDDLLRKIRAQHRGEDHGEFYEQWFEDVIVPDVAVLGATVRREGTGSTWSVEFRATNLGQGRVPVRVELLRGAWRPMEPGALEEGAWETNGGMRVRLEPGEAFEGTLSCTFPPEAIVIDRLHECIDFDRTNNVLELVAPDAPSPSPAPTGGGPAR